MIEVLNNSNFLLYCAKYYDNPQCLGTEEFLEDLNKIKYIKKLFTRYEETNELKDRLILNHVITLNNLFGPYHTNKILFFKLKEKLSMIVPFLIFLNILQPQIIGIEKENNIINTDEIPLDQNIVNALRKI